MSEKGPPLDPGLAELFQREPVPEPSPSAHARALRRLEMQIPAMRAAAPSPREASLPRAGALGSKAVSLAAATFVAGGVLGGVAVATLRPAPAPHVVYVERPSTASPQSSTWMPVPVPAAPLAAPELSVSALPPVDARPAPRPQSSGEALTAERLLIDDARTKLATGDPDAALARLQEYARRFPHGRLEEEGEALAVQALVQSKRFEAARARVRLFRNRWPESVFLPALDTTIQSIP